MGGVGGGADRLRLRFSSVEDATPPLTPDGRYLLVKGRLWRAARPDLSPSRKSALVHALMAARRGVREAQRRHDPKGLVTARKAVDLAKVGLGERGPAWWTDGAPDYNRHMARNTPYADWAAAQSPDA